MYGQPYSNKRKEKLVGAILSVPSEDMCLTKIKKVVKHTLLDPLADKDQMTHKFGSLNEDNF